MVKEKRKNRLDKGSSASSGAEFLGFSAFADSTATDSLSSGGPRLSPIYTGSDGQLSILFKKIGQKRDGSTKAKALSEVKEYFQDDAHDKKEQVVALSHLLFLYHSKLSYDDFPSVRSEVLMAISAARDRVPKACNTLLQQQQECWGMIWCAQADPSSEVKQVAETMCSTMTREAWAGVCQYIGRVLSYGRPKNMHLDLFVRRNEEETSLTELEREQLEERFERIVGSATSGLALWFEVFPEIQDSRYKDDVTCSTVWKLLISPKGALRRKAYHLLGIMCIHSQSIVYNTGETEILSDLLPNVVNQEKDAANVPQLLEALLLFISSGASNLFELCWSQLGKALSKMFKKACYGSSPSLWGPLVLPILVAIGEEDLSVSALSSLLEGRGAAIGLSDRLGMVYSVAESAAFFLLRDEEGSPTQPTFCESMISFWLECVKTYLSVNGVTSVSRDADEQLKEILGKTLCRFDEASNQKESSAIYRMDNFWRDQLPTVMLGTVGSEVNLRFKKLLDTLVTYRKQQGDQSHLFPIIRRKFHAVLKPFQSSSSSIPNDSDYQVLEACLEYSSTESIFSSSVNVEVQQECSTKIESFLLNDLLRWIVVHCSKRTTEGLSNGRTILAAHDFHILGICLLKVSAYKQKSIWESFLREIVAAECDLSILSSGLRALCRQDNLCVVVKSDAMDKLSLQVVQDSMQIDASGLEDFLETCVAPCENASRLVSTKVVKDWIGVIQKNPSSRDRQGFLALLRVLLGLIGDCFPFSRDDSVIVILESWRVGGPTWADPTLKLIRNADFEVVKSSFLEAATLELRCFFFDICNAPVDQRMASIYERCLSWALRAFRLFAVLDNGSGFERFEAVGSLEPSFLERVRISDDELSERLYWCLKLFFGFLENSDRFLLFFGESPRTDHKVQTFVSMLVAVSETAPAQASCRRESLLSLFSVDSMFSIELKHKCLNFLVRNLRLSLEDPSILWTHRSVQTLSDFSCAAFQPYLPSALAVEKGNMVDLGRLKAGDKVLYVGDPARPDSSLVLASILKVHSDDFPRLYFTIQVATDDGVQERQTVGGRLRTMASDANRSNDFELSQEEIEVRESINGLLMADIIRPVLSPDSQKSRRSLEVAGECANIVLSQIGVFGKAGLGSLRYELFQLLSSVQNNAVDFIHSGKVDAAADCLHALCLSLGLGLRTPGSACTIDYLNFDPSKSVAALVAFHATAAGISTIIDETTLSWITVSLHTLSAPEQQRDAAELVMSIADRLLRQDPFSSLFVMRGMRAVLNTCADVVQGEQKAMSTLLLDFSTSWKNNFELEPDGTMSNPEWLVPFDRFVDDALRSRPEILREAAREVASPLVGTLGVETKLWFSFRLLCLASQVREPLKQDVELDMLPRDTRTHLEHWKKGLIVDETEELEDDVLTVFEWCPVGLMLEVENWIDDHAYFDHPAESTAIARMLMWLVFLRYLETAAKSDDRIRGSFSAYCHSTGAVFFILSCSLVFLDESDRSPVRTVDDILQGGEMISLRDLSASVMFHTFEAFPTLSKGWWEADCPKSLSSTVSNFIQSKVAPETLQRELQRIREANNLGEMTIRGSTVSREVTATYPQDECTLSIAIQLPPNFPLRNVEVDGRKTLGIPENRFKRWALQIRQILNNQDGTLLEALLLWKRNVEKEFEGVEPCPVCYSVLSVKTHELPNLECNTCQNRFHSSCLHKWFASSGKSQCVLCQQPWNGTRIS